MRAFGGATATSVRARRQDKRSARPRTELPHSWRAYAPASAAAAPRNDTNPVARLDGAFIAVPGQGATICAPSCKRTVRQRRMRAKPSGVPGSTMTSTPRQACHIAPRLPTPPPAIRPACNRPAPDRRPRASIAASARPRGAPLAAPASCAAAQQAPCATVEQIGDCGPASSRLRYPARCPPRPNSPSPAPRRHRGGFWARSRGSLHHDRSQRRRHRRIGGRQPRRQIGADRGVAAHRFRAAAGAIMLRQKRSAAFASSAGEIVSIKRGNGFAQRWRQDYGSRQRIDLFVGQGTRHHGDRNRIGARRGARDQRDQRPRVLPSTCPPPAPESRLRGSSFSSAQISSAGRPSRMTSSGVAPTMSLTLFAASYSARSASWWASSRITRSTPAHC